MKKYSIFLVFILINTLFAQDYLLKTIMDSRSISMGESFVALKGYPLSNNINPANIYGLKGAEVRYNYRGLNHIEYTKDYFFYSISTSFNSPIGVFAFNYDRFNLGEIVRTSEYSPDSVIGKVEQYEHTLRFSYANELF